MTSGTDDVLIMTTDGQVVKLRLFIYTETVFTVSSL